MLESLYENDPSLVLNETFNSPNTVRGTIVGTPTFSNGTMNTGGVVGNYINTNFDFSGRNKFTVRIKGTFSTNGSLGIGQGVSGTNRVNVGATSDGRVSFILGNSSSSYGYIATSGGTYDLFFVYDGTQSTNATKAKIYINGTLQTLSFIGTIPTSCPIFTSKNARIGNNFGTGYLINNGTFEQVQIWNRVLGTVEIQARTNNSIYKNYNLIMEMERWIKISGSYTENYQTTANAIVPIGQKYFQLSSGGVIAYPSKQIAGTWEFSWYKTLDTGILNVKFIDIGPTSNYSNYGFSVSNAEALILARDGTPLMQTANSYISISTRYRTRITRTVAGVFTMYIKGGAFTNWTLVSASGGSGTNPVTNTSLNSSSFFVFDSTSGTGNYISGIRFTPYVI